MRYKKFGNKIAVRLEVGDEIFESIKNLAIKENIKLATISGIGASDKFWLGVFNEKIGTYSKYEFTGIHEITSIAGNITTVDGKPFPHIHVTAAGEGGKIVGGHLLSATICLTAEIFVDVIEGEIARVKNEELGIMEMDI